MSLTLFDELETGVIPPSEEEIRAVFSPCRAYRYALFREWDKAKDAVVFLMLNPSTADEMQDDPTIRRCIGYAKRWGYGRLRVLNLFALRSTDPKALYSHPDPVGPDNDGWIEYYTRHHRVVCAWGTHGALQGRGEAVRRSLVGEGREVVCLVETKDGHPKHPLYCRSDLVPVSYGCDKDPFALEEE